MRAGVNLSSYAFGPKLPGVHGTDYIIPPASCLEYFAKKGMTLFPIQVQWERVQPTFGLGLDGPYMARLDALAIEAARLGVQLVISMRNHARYSLRGVVTYIGKGDVTIARFAELWRQLASRYKNNPTVLFSLMNEPAGGANITTETWVQAANAAISAIRTEGYTREIFVCGNGYSGAAAWGNGWYGTANAKAMLNVVDPSNNTIFDIHCYCDVDGSGEYKGADGKTGTGDVTSEDAGVNALAGVTAWAAANKKRVWLGEFGTPNTPKSKACITKMMEHLKAHDGVWFGWAWWAAGPWWYNNGNVYALAIEPLNGAERPQLAWLLPYLTKPMTESEKFDLRVREEVAKQMFALEGQLTKFVTDALDDLASDMEDKMTKLHVALLSGSWKK